MKHIRQQRNRPQSRPKKSALIIGPEAVMAALREGPGLDRIYLQNNKGGELFEQVNRLADSKGIPVNKVPLEKLNALNVENHEGCIALIAKVQYQNLQDVISLAVENGETPLLLMLDGVTDIRNIGGIARTALCCGVHAIIIPDKGVGALNEDAIQASAGALEQMAVCRTGSLMKAVDELHLNGIAVYASDMKAAQTIASTPFTGPCCIVMGSEDKGIYPALLKICDASVQIPMAGGFESLNVSVATGIILYEAMRQRMAVS